MKKTITLFLMLVSIHLFGQCWKSISGGNSFSVGVKTDGSLWAWGYNNFGNLGDGTNTNKNVPIQIGSDTNWQSVGGEGQHTLAIKTDGTLWAWGFNIYGQLGNGTNTDSNIPIQVGTENNWAQIAKGSGLFSIVLKTDGTLWGWGLNSKGELGDGTNVDKTVPTKIGVSTNWVRVAAGTSHTLAIKSDGTLWAWGNNTDGQLGDGTNINKNVPTQIGTGTNWQNVATGSEHTIAIKTDGSLWTWGYNPAGQLGDGTLTSRNSPTHIGTATNWRDIIGGYRHSVGLKTDGTLWAWGYNLWGQLGNTSNTDTTIPVSVNTDTNWETLGGGGEHSLALKTNHEVWAWGQNIYGQLGLGNTVSNVNFPTGLVCPVSLAVDTYSAAPEMTIYPNPIEDVFHISSDGNLSTMMLYNMLGQEVFSTTLQDTESSINISNLAPGTYLVKVISPELVKTFKIFKN